METIKELKKICQPTRESPIYSMNWFDKNFLRKLSIYFTKACIWHGKTANEVTCFDFGLVITSGLFFTLQKPMGWIFGLIFFLIYLIVDCSDGEVARYWLHKGKETGLPFGVGAVLGGIVDWFVWAYVFACMSYGIFLETGNQYVFAFGFLAIIMRYIYMDMGLMPYPILHEKGLLPDAVKASEGVKLGEPRLMAVGRFIFGVQGFLIAMIAVIVVDMFVPAFNFGGFGMNARFIYLIIYGLSAGFGVLLKIRDLYKNGARIQRI